MMQKMYEAIGKDFPLREIDCKEYRTQKHSGMNFNIRAFYAEGLGHISLMSASGFFGLMKMDTLIITPLDKDMPLLSYDRVFAMGNDTLIFELYDTFYDRGDMSALADEKKKLDYPDHDLGAHWYDSIKLPESVSKKGKKKDTSAFDAFAESYFSTYLRLAKDAGLCDSAEKKRKAAVYVEGLLKNDGPSTDVFLKGIGREKTEELFRRFLFGTGTEKALDFERASSLVLSALNSKGEDFVQTKNRRLFIKDNRFYLTVVEMVPWHDCGFLLNVGVKFLWSRECGIVYSYFEGDTRVNVWDHPLGAIDFEHPYANFKLERLMSDAQEKISEYQKLESLDAFADKLKEASERDTLRDSIGLAVAEIFSGNLESATEILKAVSEKNAVAAELLDKCADLELFRGDLLGIINNCRAEMSKEYALQLAPISEIWKLD